MKALTTSLFAMGALLAASSAAAQVQKFPTPGCRVSPQELEANKKAAMAFYQSSGADRVALIDPSYIQHNPAFAKRARDKGVSDYEEFKNAFMNRPAGGPPQPDGPRPPQGNQMEIVAAECDIVTMINKSYRQDPTAAPGTFYEVYTFDTFRVKNGKLVEHWDGATIQPPAANTP